jgi:hypothetical protein
MRSNTSVSIPLLCLAALWLTSTPTHAAGEVDLSRFTVNLQVPDTPENVVLIAGVDQAVLIRFCADGDGCTARLQLIDGDSPGTDGDADTFFMSGGFGWALARDPTDVHHQDGDNTVFNVVDNNLTNEACSFSDAEASGLDTAIGFTLVALQLLHPEGGGFTCILTLID